MLKGTVKRFCPGRCSSCLGSVVSEVGGRKELSTAWHPRNRKRKAGYQGLQAEAPWTLSLQLRKAEQETVNVMRPLSRYSWEMARDRIWCWEC